MGSSHDAQITPSGDSDVDAQHHQTLNSESQNVAVDLQPSSGTPAENVGRDGGILLSFSHPATGQSASLADPSSAFQPLDSQGIIQNQPGDLRAQPASSAQPVDLFAQVAADLGMPL